MDKFTTLSGVAAPLPMVNVDTDMIIPKQFLKTIKRTGLGVHLFDELRRTPDGKEIDDFVLNQPLFHDACILIAGANFGCGSSREHAPWALADYGLRAIIAPSFADIFFNNCFQNSVLPIRLPAEVVADLMAEAGDDQGNTQFQVDVAARTLTTPSGRSITFDLTPDRQTALLEGLDDIGQTMKEDAETAAFQDKDRTARPWIYELGTID